MVAGVEVFTLPADGRLAMPTAGLLPFIDSGQLARYFIGDAGTSPQRPSNATYKLGVVRPHSSFTPHAHAGEHFVLSLGYASCTVYDEERDAAQRLRLTPGMLIRIPSLLPHAFANRGGRPLLILAANTGFGIDHEDYAITGAEADRRGLPELAKGLHALEPAAADPGRLAVGERVAAGLRRIATWLERP